MADQSHHATAAEDVLRDSRTEHSAEVAQVTVAQAQVEATLAVAYEARTANLIALLQLNCGTARVHGVDPDEVAEQVKGRLGL